jgi:hypothetical protein
MMTAPATTIHMKQSQIADTEATTVITEKATAAASPPLQQETTGNPDMLTMLMSMILSTALGLVYFIMIGLHCKIVQTVDICLPSTPLSTCSICTWREDYDNWLIRESGGSVTLQDLAHFSNNNNRPGIM